MRDAREAGGGMGLAWLGPLIVLAWGGALAVAFAVDRARIPVPPETVIVAGGGPGLLAAIGVHARAVFTAVAILGAAAGLGRCFAGLGFGSLGLGPLVDRCAELVLGGGVLAVAIFVLGHTGLLTPLPIAALLVLGWLVLAAAVWQSRAAGPKADPLAVASGTDPGARDAALVPDADCKVAAGADRAAAAGAPRPGSERGKWRDPVAWTLGLAAAAAGVVGLVTALAPPTARDALAYHLAAPKAYIAAGGIVELPWSVLSYTPFAAEMLFTAGLAIGPESSANLVHLGYGAAAVLLVAAATRRVTGSLRWGAASAAIVATVPSIVWNAGIAHNEMWMTLALTVAFVAIGQWWERRDRRLLLWCGAAIGVALAAKHTALLLVPIVALIVLARARSLEPSEQRRTLRYAVEAALIGLAIPLPWYVQNAVRTSNPLFPFFWSAFPTHSPVWDQARAEMLETYLRFSYGQRDGIAGWLRLPWDLSIRARSDVTALFDGVVGPVFLFLAPLTILALVRSRVPSWLRVAAGVAYAFVFIWATQSQQIRFLLPALPVLAIAGIAACREFATDRLRSLAIAATLALLVGLNLAAGAREGLADAPYRPVLGLESRQAYLERRLPYYRFYERLNRELGPDDRVLLVNMRNDGYYLDVPFVSDSVFEDYTIGRIVNGSATPESVRDGLRELGATHVLSRDDILLDPRFTPFESPAAASRWSGFLSAYTERLDSRDGMALYALKK
ncbi:MAG: glycosyltransferase family 39 protein [Acidobacteria bacterium]|nr:glycosyltransferase family 39 protein [Acidobacteriota bacterium]